MNKITLSLFFSFISIWSSAQVTGVNYQLEYDFEDSVYNCYLSINEGSASELSERIQLNSQFSIVTPFGANLKVVESFMPLIDQDPNRPTTWFNTLDWDYPAADPNQTFYAMRPLLNPASYYDVLAADDKVKLFSFEVDSVYGCDDIYIWRNDIDPSANDPDLAGIDFNNFFEIGEMGQLYVDNSPTKIGTPYVSNADIDCGTSVTVLVTINSLDCHGEISYSWSGPQGFSSSDQNIFIADFTMDFEGLYVLRMTDELGQESLPFFIELGNPLDAGEDKVGCLRMGTELDTLKGISTFDGFWSNGNGNTESIPMITPIGNGMALIDVDSAGIYEFIYGGTGCPDTMIYDIKKAIVPEILGDTVICFGGTTSLSPTNGGVWNSSDSSICSVTNAGIVTGLLPGEASLVFTPSESSNCPSESSYPITVLPDTSIIITGPDQLCVGQTTSILPNEGGVWVSNDPLICSITNNGLITAIGPGEVVFTYSTPSGCIATSVPVTVNTTPQITMADTELCIGDSTLLTPNSDGFWNSNNSSVCTITNEGVATAVAEGSCTFTFINMSGCTGTSEPIIVKPIPSIEIFSSALCVGDTTRLNPQTGGSWTISDSSIATINNSGLATGVASGTVTFIFTDQVNSCNSLPSDPLLVNALPLVEFRGLDTISVDQTTVVFPDAGGVWVSSNTGVATVNNEGIVRGIEEGEAILTFIDENGCESEALKIVVRGCAAISIVEEEIFIGDTIQLFSTYPGIWTSSDTSIVKIVNDRAIGLNIGMVNLSFTTNDTCAYNDIPLNVVKAENRVFLNTFIDLNNNSIYDANIDEQLPNVIVQVPSLNTTFITNQDGLYQTILDTGSYELTFSVPYGNWTEAQKIFQVDVYDSEVFVFVGFTPDVNEDNANVIVGSNRLKCDSIASINLTLFNKGNTIINGDLHIVIDDNSSIVQSTPFPSNASGNELTFAVVGLTPGYKFSPVIDVIVGNPIIIGEVLNFNAFFISASGDTISNVLYTDSIRCSFGPNDKRSWPDRGGIKRTLLTESLDYTIRFQNTGSEIVNNVEIKDVLDVNLDPLSVVVKESSHNVRTSILGDTLCFVFDDIVLPDSTTNFVASQGFISFEVKAKEGLEDSIIIENKANIVYNSNPPVETNLTFNTMVEDFICFYDTLSFNVCNGDTVQTTQNIYVEVGAYEEIRTGEGGCDTLVNIVLTEGEKLLISEPSSAICLGDSAIVFPFGDYNFINYSPTIIQESSDSISIIAKAAGIGKYALSIDSIQCASDTLEIEVYDTPSVTSLNADTLCIGDEGEIITEGQGTWVSSNDSILSISNDGKFIGISIGTAGFRFTDDFTGCISDELTFTVINRPSDSIWTDEFQLNVNPDGIGYTWYACNDSLAIITTDVPSFSPEENGSYYAIITSIYCSTQTDCIDFIQSNTRDLLLDKIQVYPNPVKDVLQINTEANGQFHLLDISGKELMSYDYIPHSIDLNGLNGGIYILKFRIEGESIYRKVIKE